MYSTIISQFSETSREGIQRTYRPLHRQKTEQERQTRVPTTCLIDDTIGSEHVGSGMHLGPGSRCQQRDDDDCMTGDRQ